MTRAVRKGASRLPEPVASLRIVASLREIPLRICEPLRLCVRPSTLTAFLQILHRKINILVLTLLVFFASCNSTPEKVKANKEKYIQVALENSKPVDMSNISDLYRQAREGNVEGKMKYLGVDSIQTVYEGISEAGDELDSVVIFVKGNYKILYDFATLGRTTEFIKLNSGLTDFERIDERLYIGKR